MKILVQTEVVIMNYIFYITPYNTLKVNGNFGGTYRFHPQVFRVSQARNKQVWQVARLSLFSYLAVTNMMRMGTA
jgi:hypothetical protein